MTFTVKTLAQSLADYLSPEFPGVTFFEDPNQQGTTVPAMFLQVRYTQKEDGLGGRVKRTLGLDLTYLEDYNLPNLSALYSAAEEKLALLLRNVPYTNNGETALLHARNVEGNIDLDAAHEKFELVLFLEPEDDSVLMESMTLDLNIEVRA